MHVKERERGCERVHTDGFQIKGTSAAKIFLHHDEINVKEWIQYFTILNRFQSGEESCC